MREGYSLEIITPKEARTTQLMSDEEYELFCDKWYREMKPILDEHRRRREKSELASMSKVVW